MYFYTVLTYPGGCPESILKNTVDYALEKFPQYIIVTEMGKSTKNLHVNVVYSIPDELAKHWSSNSNKNFKRCYDGLTLPVSQKNLIRTKKCSSPENVIGGYLQKEDLAKIIVNKGFDVQNMILEAKKNKPLPKVNINNFNEILHEYCSYNPTYDLYVQTVEDMIRQQYKLVSFLSKLKLLYAEYDILYCEGSLKSHNLK